MTANKTFWPEDDVCQTPVAVSTGSAARSWCDPAAYRDIVGVDFGKGAMHLYWCSTGKHKQVPVASARDWLLSLQPGTLVLAEPAHLAVARTSKSLAQPFTEHELLNLYHELKARNITLKFFPHAHSGTRALAWAVHNCPELADAKKSDKNDAMAIALYVKYCNAVSLADPPACFSRCPRRDYGISVRARANIVLNAERTTGYAGDMFPHVISLGKAIRRKVRRLNLLACISIASLIATEIEGEPRMYARNGASIGANQWLEHVARMTPFHHRGGIARSNLMFHSFRAFLKAHARQCGVSVGTKKKLVPFGQHNAQQAAVRNSAMRVFRRLIRDAYRAGVAISEERGFRPFDPMADGQEASHGR